jgi:hypothetical protein
MCSEEKQWRRDVTDTMQLQLDNPRSTELGGARPQMYRGSVVDYVQYYANIFKSEGNGSLIGHAIKEMKTDHNPTITSWFSCVEKIKTFLGLKYSTFCKIDVIGNLIKKQMKSKFEQF